MRRKEFALYVAPSALTMAALLVVPLGLAVIWSFQDVTYGQTGHWVGLSNFSEALGTDRFRSAALFTLGFTFAATVLLLVLGFLIALALYRVRRWRSVCLGLLLVPYVVPPVVGALVFSWLFNDTFGGLINWTLGAVGVHVDWLVSMWPARSLLVLYTVWNQISFPTLIFLAGLHTLPPDLLEAAAIDGAGWLGKHLFVILPWMRRLIGLVSLIAIMDNLRVFDAIRVVTPASQTVGTDSVMTYVYDVALGETQRLGFGSAVSLMVMIGTFVVLAPFLRAMYRDVRAEQ